MKHDEAQKQAMFDYMKALSQEVKKFNLEYSELSTVIRSLLLAVYVRGGTDVIKNLKLSPEELAEKKAS